MDSAKQRQSMQQQINNLKAESNPTPRARRIPSTPGPMRANAAVWINRRIRLVKTTTSVSGTATFTSGDIAKALDNSGQSVDVRVCGFSAWNASSPALTSNFIKVTASEILFLTTGLNAASTVGPFEDYGGGSSIARVGVNFPDLILTAINMTSTATSTAFTVNSDPTDRTSGLSIQTLVLDIQCRVRF
jgi:hypothetical protein